MTRTFDNVLYTAMGIGSIIHLVGWIFFNWGTEALIGGIGLGLFAQTVRILQVIRERD